MAEKGTIDERRQLAKTIQEQKETLRQLQMVKMYRKKNNLEELEVLIDKWRGVCQETLTTLQEKMPEPRPDLGSLIKNFNLDAELLKYNEDEEEFDG
ncbi:swi5-dependent recombination DNA repair protein 1 homolog [Amphiura filiformis]|uniref:swi5-dependent recombination DNA repair protein 1 homolog n=1 Tax=Amphiura filiformis TaxID=82378 RepID=UPI003B216726